MYRSNIDSLFLYLDYSGRSNRFEDQSAIHSDLYSLDENDIDRTDSLWNNISFECMDGCRVSVNKLYH